MSFSFALKLDESLDILWDSIKGISSTRTLVFNLATTGKLAPKLTHDQHPQDLLDSFDKGVVAHESVAGWLSLNLGDCAEIYNGNSTSISEKAVMERNKDGLNYIATKDVGYGFEPIKYSTGLRIGSQDNNFKIAPKNALLICLEGGSAGKKMGLVEQEIAFGNKLFAVVCNSWIDPNYLLMYFLSSKFQSDFQAQMSGIIGGISKAKFSNLQIPIPPLQEQKRIVNKVKELMNLCDSLETQFTLSKSLSTAARRSAVDAISTAQSQGEFETAWHRIQQNWDLIAGTTEAISDLRKLIEFLGIRGQLTEKLDTKETAEDLLRDLNLTRDVFATEDTDIISRNWAITNLGSIIQLEYGKSLPKQSRSSQGDVPVYGSNGIVGYHDEALIDSGVIVVGRKGSIGQVNIAEGKSWVIDTAYYVVPKANMSLEYLALLIKTSNLQSLNKATAIPGLNRNDAYSQMCFLAPPEEQIRIVQTVNALLEVCDRLAEALQERENIASKFARSAVSESA